MYVDSQALSDRRPQGAEAPDEYIGEESPVVSVSALRLFPDFLSSVFAKGATTLNASSSHNTSQERPVILINGMGSNFDAQWRRHGWVAKLEAAGRTVIGVDLPGHGASKDAVGRDAADLILEEAAKHAPVDGIGFSAGAWALLLAASEQPALFARIAVLAAADLVLTGGLHTEAMNQPLISALRSPAEPTDNPMVTLLRTVIADAGNDPEAVAGYLASSKRFVTIEGLGSIKATALIIDGGADETGQSELVSRTIPHAERTTIEGANHFEIPNTAHCLDVAVSFINTAD